VSVTAKIEENRPLAPFTTFQIGGPARWFFNAETEAEIVEATAWARDKNIPLFVLGGGSNLLISDDGFNGLVLRIALRGLTIEGDPGTSTKIYRVAAGEDWDRFVQRAVDDNCAGVECLAGIPGTVGGTPVQNVGAYGQEVSSVIDRVRAFDLKERAFVDFTPEECAFAYRRSRFNTTDRGRFIVTRVDYRLAADGAPTLRYPELQRAVANECAEDPPSLKDVAAIVRRIRQSKGMLLVEGDPDCRSAGSFFKNPIVPQNQLAHIATIAGKEPPHFQAGIGPHFKGLVKLSAAWLIEHAGFAKSYAVGGAGISSRHTLALINRGNATAAEITALATQIAEAVRTRFDIALEMEPVLVGFDSAKPS
jgi:UDP-N-acetylmuramate dehydrogenase